MVISIEYKGFVFYVSATNQSEALKKAEQMHKTIEDNM